MISLDTNMLLSYLNPADANHDPALSALKRYAAQGYVICPPVYSELRAGRYWRVIEGWLTDSATPILWPMPPEVWDLAGERSAQYTAQRRSGQAPRRVLADFLIGAHAEFHGLDLLSFDQTVYGSVFPDVTLLRP